MLFANDFLEGSTACWQTTFCLRLHFTECERTSALTTIANDTERSDSNNVKYNGPQSTNHTHSHILSALRDFSVYTCIYDMRLCGMIHWDTPVNVIVCVNVAPTCNSIRCCTLHDTIDISCNIMWLEMFWSFLQKVFTRIVFHHVIRFNRKLLNGVGY